MDFFILGFKYLMANILLIVVTSTLIGFVIRGIYQTRVIMPYNANHKIEWYSLSYKKGFLISIVSLVIIIIISFVLFNNLNLYVFSAFIILLVTRIKDLINEIRTGLKTSKINKTNDWLDVVLTIFSWSGFIIFNYGIYIFLNKN